MSAKGRSGQAGLSPGPSGDVSPHSSSADVGRRVTWRRVLDDAPRLGQVAALDMAGHPSLSVHDHHKLLRAGWRQFRNVAGSQRRALEHSGDTSILMR